MTILRVIDARGITITGLQTTLRLAKTGDIADFRPIGRKYAIFAVFRDQSLCFENDRR